MKKKLKKYLLFFLSVIFLPFSIFILNLYLVSPLFKGELTQNVGSIEIVYVQAGKFIMDFWPHLSWNPLWYNGFPLSVLYNPVLPYLEVFLKFITGLSLEKIFRIISAVSYALAPVGLYYFVRYLTKRNFGGFTAALAFSLLPSFNYLFSGPADYGHSFYWAPWHFLILNVFGEGPHILALPFVPLSGFFFLRALRNFNYKNVIISAFFGAVVALTNMIAFLATLILFLAVTFSQASLKDIRMSRVFKQTLVILLVLMGLIAFWYNVPFIKASFGFGEGGGIFGNYLRFLLVIPVILSAILAGFYFIFHTRHRLLPLAFTILWFLPLFFFAFAWYQWEIAFAPQAIRYMPEMNMAVVILISLLVTYLYKWFTKKEKFYFKISGFLLWILVPGLIIYGSWPFIKNSHQPIKAQENIEDSYEYQISKKIEKAVGEKRVYVTGNNAFFLNLYTKVPQLRGGLDQAATNDWWAHINYQLLKGSDSEVAAYLVKAANLNYVLVNLANSPNFYHDYDYPEKFQYWTKVFADRGDILYQSPLVQPSLFQVVDGNFFDNLIKPKNAIDKEPLERYARWVDDLAKPTTVEVNWINNGKIVLKTDLSENEALSAQITYNRGWRAKAGGSKLKIKKDVMSNLVIFPQKPGPQEIILEYEKTWDIWLGYLITLMTIILIVAYPFKLRPKIEKARKAIEAEERREKELIKKELKKINSKFS